MANKPSVPSIFDLSFTTAKGTVVKLSDYRGKTLLIVNTATKCGFAPQFKGLESLHKAFRNKGLVVLGMPCDQFAHQEPTKDTDMAETCLINFGVTFPLAAKSNVNGPDTNPVFQFLKDRAPGILGKDIRWNFTKFLIMPDGITVKRFAPGTQPDRIKPYIHKFLPQPEAV